MHRLIEGNTPERRRGGPQGHRCGRTPRLGSAGSIPGPVGSRTAQEAVGGRSPSSPERGSAGPGLPQHPCHGVSTKVLDCSRTLDGASVHALSRGLCLMGTDCLPTK